MLSEEQQELLDAFSEIRTIGGELAEKINEWNENNIEEEKDFPVIQPEMSGDSVIILYTENGVEESEIIKMLISVGFSISTEAEDKIGDDDKNCREINEYLNEFLSKCIETAQLYPYFIKEIKIHPGNTERKDEVRIIIPSNADFRKLPHTDARKIMFMHFLKDIREQSIIYSMMDESLCFCSHNSEFIIILKQVGVVQRRT